MNELKLWIVPIWCMGAALIFVAIRDDIQLQRLIENKILTQIGDYSFGIYAIQWPIILFVSCGTTLMFILNEVPYILGGILGVSCGFIVTIVLSVIIYKGIYTKLYLALKKLVNRII